MEFFSLNHRIQQVLHQVLKSSEHEALLVQKPDASILIATQCKTHEILIESFLLQLHEVKRLSQN